MEANFTEEMNVFITVARLMWARLEDVWEWHVDDNEQFPRGKWLLCWELKSYELAWHW